VTTDELVRTTRPLIGQLGAAFYFTPSTTARGKELGIDGFRFYFVGRGGVLGDVEAEVVVSAFGYFRPELVTRMWDTARAVLDPRQAAREFLACCHAYGRAHYSGLAGLDGFCRAAETVVAAAPVAALALFAGIKAEPLPDDLPARAAQLVAVLREFRGSAHLVAVVASGLEPVTAHYIARPDMWTQFGYDEADAPVVTDADRAAREAAEELTDRLVRPAFAALDEEGRRTLVSGLEAMKAATAG
jgi:hypothetical protein